MTISMTDAASYPNLMRQFELKDLLNFLPVAVAIAEDPRCEKITVNRVLAKTMASYYSENLENNASFLSSPLNKVFRQRQEVTSPDELPLRRAVLKGEFINGEEMDLVLANGTVITMMSYAMPWVHGGKITGGIAAYVDMTDLRKARAEIRLLQDHVQELVTPKSFEI